MELNNRKVSELIVFLHDVSVEANNLIEKLEEIELAGMDLDTNLKDWLIGISSCLSTFNLAIVDDPTYLKAQEKNANSAKKLRELLAELDSFFRRN
jgi:hypothetical protein